MKNVVYYTSKWGFVLFYVINKFIRRVTGQFYRLDLFRIAVQNIKMKITYHGVFRLRPQ